MNFNNKILNYNHEFQIDLSKLTENQSKPHGLQIVTDEQALKDFLTHAIELEYPTALSNILGKIPLSGEITRYLSNAVGDFYLKSLENHEPTDLIDNISVVAFEYTRLYQGYQEKYTGDELSKCLNNLDEGYNLYFKQTAQEYLVRISSKFAWFGFQAAQYAAIENNSNKDSEIIYIDATDKKKSIDDAFEKGTYDLLSKGMTELLYNINQTLTSFSQSAKEYMLTYNKSLETDLEKKDFENYLTKNSKSKGTYTVEEMQLITDVFCPIITTQGNWFSIAKDKMKAAVEKLDETGFSKNVLKFIHMLTTPFPPVSDTAKNKYKDILEELEELSKEMEENYLQRIKINNEYNNNYVSKIKSQLSLNNDVLNIEDKINSLLNGLIERLKVDK